jgi:hypothetical protein
MDLQRFQYARRQHGAQAERQVRALPDLVDRGCDEMRQALSAELRAASEAVPSGIDELAIGVLEPCRRGHPAFCEPRALLVALAVQRIENLLGELRGLSENRLDELRVHFAVPRQRRHLSQAGQLLDRELHVLQRSRIH